MSITALFVMFHPSSFDVSAERLRWNFSMLLNF